MADEEIKTLAVAIAMEDGSFQSGVKNLKQQLGVIDSEFKSSIAGVKDWGKGLDGLKANATALGNKINVQKQIVQQYTEQLQKSKDALATNSQKMLDLKGRVESAKTAWEQSKAAVGANAEATKTLEAEYSKLNKQYESAESLVRKNNTSVQGYAIQVNNAKGMLNKMEDELSKANKEIDLQSSNWQKLSKSLDGIKEKLKSVGEGFTKAGKTMSMAITAPIIAAGVASAKLASDMSESLNKVDVAFKDNSQEVKDWAKTTLASFGLAQGSALDAASLYGDMGTAMGQSTAEAAKMSTSLVGLAADMASFKNISTEQANEALRGIYTGEGESLKTLGVIMQDSTLIAYAQATGQQKAYKEMTQAEKVALRYAFVMDATKNAQGDFARTSEGTANQTRIFGESLKELGTSFGQYILPVVTPMIAKLNEMVQSFGRLDEGTKKTILVVAGIAAVVGPVLVVIGSLVTAVSAIAGAFAAASGAIAAAGGFIPFLTGTLLPIAGVIAAIGGLVAAGVLLYKNWDTIKAKAQELWTGITTTFSDIKTSITEVWTSVKTTTSEAWENLKNTISNGLNSILNFIQPALTFYKTIFQNAWDIIKNIMLGAVLIVLDIVTGNFTKLGFDIGNIWNNIKTALMNIWNAIKDVAGTAWNALKTTVITLSDAIKTSITNIWNGLLTWFEELPAKLQTIGSDMFTHMKNGVMSTITTVKEAIITGITTAIDWIKALPGQALQWGSDFVDGFKTGIMNAMSGLLQAVQNIAAGIRSFLHFSTPDQGPLADYESWMPDFMGGLAAGIEKNKYLVRNAIQGLTTDMGINATVSVSGGIAGFAGPSVTIINRGTIVGSGGMDEFATIVSRKISDQYGLTSGGGW